MVFLPGGLMTHAVVYRYNTTYNMTDDGQTENLNEYVLSRVPVTGTIATGIGCRQSPVIGWISCIGALL